MKTTKTSKDTKRILFIRFSALGDVAMTIPVIYSFARNYPQYRIYVATRPFFLQMFFNCPENIEVISIDLKNKYKGLWGCLRLIKKLSALHPDYVFDMHNVLRTWVIGLYFWLAGKQVFTTSKYRFLRRNVVKGTARMQSMTDNHIHALNKAGFHFPMTFRSIIDDEKRLHTKSMGNAAIKIGIAPFARYKNKTYPFNKVLSVIDTLAQKGHIIYMFGNKEEAGIYNAAISKYDNVIPMNSFSTLYEELHVMANLDVMITMDSANHHLASLVNTRVISIWGGTTPACGFMAYGQSADDAVCLNLKCQPCTISGSDKCRRKDFACLNNISETALLSIIRQVISEKRIRQDYIQ